MNDEQERDDGHEAGEAAAAPEASSGSDEDFVLLEAYDLDGDGEVSPIEEVRGDLGIVDARLEQIAEEGGVKGAIADAVHKVVDKLDND